MPMTLVDRLPLPNLKVYTAGSVALLAAAVYHAVGVTSDPAWRANATLQAQKSAGEDGPPLAVEPVLLEMNATRNLTEQFVDVLSFMMQEPLCMWTIINTCYCSLAIFAFIIQRAVFGTLRVSEAQRIKDKLWNYVFYKFIFVFGVINVQYMDEVLLWCAWFTIIGFLHLLSHLCKDRFEYLSSSPRVSPWSYARLVALVCGVVVAGVAMQAAVVEIGIPPSTHTFYFMTAECSLVLLSALHTLARYELVDHEADVAGPVAYYTNLLFDASSLLVEAAHVVHMVWVAHLLVSAPSLVLLLQLRHLLHQLQARLRKHRLYTALTDHMSQHYPMASKEEVEKNQDNCAICWEPMKEARKLPCSHLFHNSCLCQWVQQDASCPTCRRALHATPGAPPLPLPLPLTGGAGAGAAGVRSPLAGLAPLAADLPAPRDNNANRLFHFDGSRYVSWLPSFSVEVTRLRAPPPHQLDAMARQVQTLFPQYNLQELAVDLAATHSVDLTVHNILEGRLTPAAPLVPPEPAPLPARVTAAPVVTTAPTRRTPDLETASIAVQSSILSRPTTSGTARDASTATAAHPAPHSPEHFTDVDHASTPFSKEATEREYSLQRRKEEMIAAARQRYLEKLSARGQAQPGNPASRPPHS